MFGCPSPSPYVIKTEIQLQMFGLDFDRAMADLESVPKHKAPYVMDGDRLIEDSNFIRAYFEDKLGKTLDADLSPPEKVTAWALERMAESHLTAFVGYERWIKDENFNKGPIAFFMAAPEPMRQQIIDDSRQSVNAVHQGTGFGRHSEADRIQLADWDLMAIAMQLGDQNFLFGDEPSAPDASVSAVLMSCLTDFFDSPLPGLVQKYPNLVAYAERMKSLYLAESKWPVPEMA
tara:strand:+ start:8504 stop:9202 length:699 start_codon:yes stop_codon:yes gene_type:complete